MARAIIVEPYKPSRIEDIKTDLKSLQRIVGGYIETVYPFKDDYSIMFIVNEEGKILGLPRGFVLMSDDGFVYDEIAGTFIVIATDEDGELCSLSDEQIGKFNSYIKKVFYNIVNGNVH